MTSRRIAVGGRPGAIVFGGGRVWVADEAGGGVTRDQRRRRPRLQARHRPPRGAAAPRASAPAGSGSAAPRPASVRRIDLGDADGGAADPRRPRPRRGHRRRRPRLGRQQPLRHRHPGRPGDPRPPRRADPGRRPPGRDRRRHRRRLGRQRRRRHGQPHRHRRAARRSATRSTVGPTPGAVAVGEEAVWVADNGDGTVTRIEP